MEIFVKIKGFDDYEISNKGRVKSLERNLNVTSKLGNSFYRHYEEKIMKTRTDVDGYQLVNLRKDKKCYTLKVHRLVAEAFIPNPNNYQIINHKDYNRSNNSVENLEWCTYQYNNTYGDVGYKKALKTGKPLIAYKDGVEVGRYISSYDAAKSLNIEGNDGNIRSMLRGAKYPKTVKGYSFKYFE